MISLSSNRIEFLFKDLAHTVALYDHKMVCVHGSPYAFVFAQKFKEYLESIVVGSELSSPWVYIKERVVYKMFRIDVLRALPEHNLSELVREIENSRLNEDSRRLCILGDPWSELDYSGVLPRGLCNADLGAYEQIYAPKD